jgi:hypothetical protein
LGVDGNMVSPNVNRLLEEAKTLTVTERQQLLVLLNDLPSEASSDAREEELDQVLLKTRVINTIPPRDMDPGGYQSWKPIEIEGKPISETIVEERR